MSNFFYGIANASTVAAHQAKVVASAGAAKRAHASAVVAKRAVVAAERRARRAAKGLNPEGSL